LGVFNADPTPVEPAAAFMAHAPPAAASPFEVPPNNWVRAPGDVAVA
jgi:hypothetical protein